MRIVNLRIAYDEDLANRIRELVSSEKGIAEKRMFGGLAFLVNGNMAVAASGSGGLLVRVDPSTSERLTRSGRAAPLMMRGRPLAGWLRVDDDHLKSKAQLAAWTTRGIGFARTLPKK